MNGFLISAAILALLFAAGADPVRSFIDTVTLADPPTRQDGETNSGCRSIDDEGPEDRPTGVQPCSRQRSTPYHIYGGRFFGTYRNWMRTREFQQGLSEESAETYFKREVESIESTSEKTDLLLSEGLPQPLFSYRAPLISKRLAWERDRTEKLLRANKELRPRLEFEMNRFVNFLLSETGSWGIGDGHPELREPFEHLERLASRRQSFLEPAYYDRNLEMVRVLTHEYGRLRSRWLRYRGAAADRTEWETRAAALEELRSQVYPEDNYVLVDTASNRIYVLHQERILLDATCSTGSGQQLVHGEQSWIFETPRGEFSIRRVIPDPIWRKPDWAFISEGEAPPSRERDRLAPDALGDYALDFGDGYFIHGTLYQRLLGEPVTHGCIRMANGDLDRLVELVGIGSRIYIF